MTWWWVAAAALASGGLDPTSIDVLGAPTYLAPELGWTAPVLDSQPGRVRVWMHRDEAEAVARFEAQRALQTRTRELEAGADQAVGNGLDLVLLREAELVAIIERPEGEALDLAERLVAAIKQAGPWPEAPGISVTDGHLEVGGRWAEVRVVRAPGVRRVTDGLLTGLPGLSVSPVVRDEEGRLAVRSGEVVEVLCWDVFGRGSVVRYEVP
jgi:hypothetical protein